MTLDFNYSDYCDSLKNPEKQTSNFISEKTMQIGEVVVEIEKSITTTYWEPLDLGCPPNPNLNLGLHEGGFPCLPSG